MGIKLTTTEQLFFTSSILLSMYLLFIGCCVFILIKGQLQELIGSLYLVGTGDRTQIIKPGSKCFTKGAASPALPPSLVFMWGISISFFPFLLKFKYYITSSPVSVTPHPSNVNLLNWCYCVGYFTSLWINHSRFLTQRHALWNLEDLQLQHFVHCVLSPCLLFSGQPVSLS